MVKTDFFQGPLQQEKRNLSIELGSVPNTARASEDLQPGSVAGGSGWKIPKRRR